MATDPIYVIPAGYRLCAHGIKIPGPTESVSAQWSGSGAVVYGPKHEVVCGPMSWRPAPDPPEEPKPDVWAGLRQRTEEIP